MAKTKYDYIKENAKKAGASESEAIKAAADQARKDAQAIISKGKDKSTEAIADANKRAGTSPANTGGNIPTVPKTPTEPPKQADVTPPKATTSQTSGNAFYDYVYNNAKTRGMSDAEAKVEANKATTKTNINTRLPNESDADYSRRLAMQGAVQQKAAVAGGSSVMMDNEQASKVLQELDTEYNWLDGVLQEHEQHTNDPAYNNLPEEDREAIYVYMSNATKQRDAIDAQREYLKNLVGTVEDADNAAQTMVLGTDAASLNVPTTGGVTESPWYTDPAIGKELLNTTGEGALYYGGKLFGEYAGSVAQDKVLDEAAKLVIPMGGNGFGKFGSFGGYNGGLPTKHVPKLFQYGDVVDSMKGAETSSGTTVMFGATTAIDALWNKYKYDTAVKNGEMSEMDANFYTAGETLYDTGKNLGGAYLAWGMADTAGAAAAGNSLLATAGSVALPVAIGVGLDVYTGIASDVEYTNFCDLFIATSYEKIVGEGQTELNNKLAEAQMEYLKALEESTMINQYREWGVLS